MPVGIIAAIFPYFPANNRFVLVETGVSADHMSCVGTSVSADHESLLRALLVPLACFTSLPIAIAARRAEPCFLPCLLRFHK
jgi:hypothetical protein